MRIDKRDEHKHEVKVNGVAIEEVESFKYLGSVKTKCCDCSRDSKTRIAIAKRKTLELTEIWKSRQIDKTVKIKLVKTLIWPIISYGAEASTLSTANEKKLMAAEQWIYRHMLHVSWKERGTNESMFEEIGEAPGLSPQVVQNKLSYFGHTCREGGCQIVKAAVLGLKGGRRKRGCPRLCYTDNVKEWLKPSSLKEAVALAQERWSWMKIKRMRNTVQLRMRNIC